MKLPSATPAEGLPQPEKTAFKLDTQLNTILASKAFRQAPRSSRLLRFLVESVLAEREGEIKESVLGVEVFDRPAGYDPKSDPIVRVQVRRLRQKLTEYYVTEGLNDPVRIEIPVGSYVPEFIEIAQPAAAPVSNPDQTETSATGQATATSWWRRFGLTAALTAIVLPGGFLLWNQTVRTPTPQPLPALKPLTNVSGFETAPAISPDGKTVAFAHGVGRRDKNIYLQGIGAANAVPFTNSSHHTVSPVWSPDGQAIAYARPAMNGTTELLARHVQGGEERLLATLQMPMDGVHFDWSSHQGGGYLVASECSSPETPCALVLISPKTGERVQLSFPAKGTSGDAEPHVSADGKYLAFRRSTAPTVAELMWMPFPERPFEQDFPTRLSQALRQLRSVPNPPGYVSGLAWSQDGTRLIVAAGRMDGDSTLWQVDPRTGNWGMLTPSTMIAVQPATSRQSNAVVFVSREYDVNIWRVGMDTRSVASRIIDSTRLDSTPDLSPDGRRIAFRSNRGGNDEIWISDRDGASVMRLTTLEGAQASHPRWSPDGREVAFQVSDGLHVEIRVLGVSDGKQVFRIAGPQRHALPRWSRDGKSLYFSSDRSGTWQLWRQNLSGGEAVQITQSGGFVSMESPDGRWLYYMKPSPATQIYRVPIGASGPDESKAENVLGGLSSNMWGNWYVSERELFFLDNVNQGAQLQAFHLGTRQIRTIRTLENFVIGSEGGLSVSADGQELYVALVERRGSDLVLFESFNHQ